ncbi:MAG TPA: MBL fold metallo-hydrolase [Desulfopila sp.]|nr:MBL fold metallo-hydrolase [Desulfopila sp.]
MLITFIGTGEAGDHRRRNTSVLIECHGREHLLDCGFSSAMGYFQNRKGLLTSIWISHLHGDHFFGIPQLIVSFYTEKRQEPLHILCGADCRQTITAAIELAYPGLLEKIKFAIIFVQLEPLHPLHRFGLDWDCAAVSHSQPAFGLRLQARDKSLYYGGDGKPTAEAARLIRGCDIVIHEAFSLRSLKPTHSSIEECFTLARDLELPVLVLVHINRETRKNLEQMKSLQQPPPTTRLLIADDDDRLRL